MRKLMAVTLFAAASIHGAMAQTVDWRSGTAVVTAVSKQCSDNGVNVGSQFDARYRHPGLGTNGNFARLSIFSRRSAHHFRQANDFGRTFQAVDVASFIGGGIATTNTAPPAGPYQPDIRMLRRQPANINETTPWIFMTLKIRGFYVGAGIPGCNLDLNVMVLRD